MTVIDEDVKRFVLEFMNEHGPIPGADEAEQLGVGYLDSGLLDSMAVVELVTTLEDRFDVRFEPEDMQSEDFRTIGGLIDVVLRRSSSSAPPTTSSPAFQTSPRPEARSGPSPRSSIVGVRGALIRLLQVVGLWAPGATTLRVRLHRLRGVTIGQNVFIGSDVILETAFPELIYIGSDVTISVRVTVVAHGRGPLQSTSSGDERYSVRIEDGAFIGPGTVVLPGVTIGRGAVVSAGSIVSASVEPMTMVRGNPAKPVARLEQALLENTPMSVFLRGVRPIP